MRRAAVVMMLMVCVATTALGQGTTNPDLKKLPEAPVPKVAAPDPTEHTLGTNVDLVPGEKAPDFQMESSLGGTIRSADLKGGWYVLVFDQGFKQITPVRTVQDSLVAIGVKPFGVCRDRVDALRALALRQHLALALLSDPTGEISQLFGMYDDGNETIRSGIVIVDGAGVVRMVVQGPSLHADDVLQMVRHVVRGM